MMDVLGVDGVVVEDVVVNLSLIHISRAAWKKASPGRNMMTNSGHGENWAK